MSNKTVKHCLPKLNFIVNYKKEFWFIKNKYSDARKAIGKKRFGGIINFNIPEIAVDKYERMVKDVYRHTENKREDVLPKLLKQKMIYQKKWLQFGSRFFRQMEEVTGLTWRKRKYDLYFLFSCFWGGDYDENGNTIYVGPLLKHGDPLYVIFHELSHLLFWEFVHTHYTKGFIKRNHFRIWKLSEVLVNYPLLKISIKYRFPLIIPSTIKNADEIVKNFSAMSFCDIIQKELKKAR